MAFSARRRHPARRGFDAAWEGHESRGAGISRLPASRFIFEARLRTAVSLGDTVSKRLSGIEPAAKIAECSGEATGLLNRDPEVVGIPERYAASKAQSTASNEEGWGWTGRARRGGRSTIGSAIGCSARVASSACARRTSSTLTLQGGVGQEQVG